MHLPSSPNSSHQAAHSVIIRHIHAANLSHLGSAWLYAACERLTAKGGTMLGDEEVQQGALTLSLTLASGNIQHLQQHSLHINQLLMYIVTGGGRNVYTC